MKEMKRILSLVLCFVMLVGLLPNLAFLAKAEEAPLDALVIFTDLHAMYNGDSSTGDTGYKQTKITNMMNALKATGLPFSSVHSGGDAFSSNSNTNTNYTDTVTGYIQAVLGDIPVGYVWSDHDRGALDNATDKNELDKTSHLAYGAGADGVYGTADDDNYYVYYLSMGDMCSYDRYGAGFNYTQTDNSGRVSAGFTPTVAQAIANFQADAAKLDKSKPLFIVSHQPLFDNRNDNAWAEDWFDAINAVAAEMDVAFFYGHNHKYDSSSDYYYAKGSSMPVATADNWGWKYETKAGYLGYLPSMDLSSESKTLNFTHMCGGYFDPATTSSTSSTTREGTMVAVEIYADRIEYTTYNNAGQYTGNYALDVSVKRDHASGGTVTPDSTEAPEETTVPEETEPVTTVTETVYVLVDAPVDGEEYLIANISLTNKGSLSSDWDDEEGVLLIKNGTGTATYDFVSVNGGATDGIVLNAGEITVDGVTYSGGYITMAGENDNAVWTAEADGDAWYFENDGDYLALSSNSPVAESEAYDWYYTGNNLRADATSGRYLYFSYINTGKDNWYWNSTTNASGSSTRHIYFYQEVEIETEQPTTPSEPTENTLSSNGVTVKALGLTALEVAAVTEGAAFEAAAAVLAEGFAAYDIVVEGFENGSGTATVTVPAPAGVTDPVVYYVSDDGLTLSPMDIISVEGGFVTFETDHFSTYAVGARQTGGWVEITAPVAATPAVYNYKYVLDTDGVNANTKYLIVNTGSNGSAYVLVNNGDGSVSRAQVTIANGAIVVEDETDIAWTFSGTSSGSVGNQGRYLYPQYSGLATNNDSGSSSLTISNRKNGAYRLSRGSSWTTYYVAYSNNSWTASTSISDVYLFAYDSDEKVQDATEAQDGLYGKITGAAEIVVDRGLTADEVLAIVKSEVDVWYTNASAMPDADDTGTQYDDDGEGMSWTLDSSYSGTVAGSYTVTVKYNDTVLGTVTVKVPEFTFKAENAILSDTVGSVAKGAASDAEVGVILTITDDEGGKHEIPVTVDMLTDAQGNPVSTANKATFENLTLTYNGVKITETFTLNVVGRAGNNYPEHPEEGAVKVNKTATGVDFQESGLAQIEVSTSGVPMSVGVDVIVMLDLSSSMERCIAHDSKTCTVSGCVTRLEALQSALATFQSILQSSPNKDIIKVAIADFNVFYTSGPVAYDSSDYIEASFGASGTNHIFTGDGTISAGAFEPAAELDVSSYSLNYGSGTNYDYAFDTIYQLGSAIRAYNEQNNQSERELVVLFMSDGAANQFNFYRSSGSDKAGYTDDDPDYKWNFWLDGTWTADDLTSSNLNSTTHSYYYDLNDHDKDGHLNEHRMANAIKGDPDTKYEVIRKSASVAGGVTLEAGSKTDLYMAPGLGATLYSVAFDIANDGPITDEAAFAALEQIASSDEQYVNATSQTELENAFRQFASDILYAANNARFVDQMGANFDVQLLPLRYRPAGESSWDNAKSFEPKIEIVSYDIYTRSEVGTVVNGVTVTEAMIGSRKGTSSVLETITTKMVEAPKGEDGKYTGKYNLDQETGNYVEAENGQYNLEVYSDKVNNGQTNILGENGVIYAKSFYYNTNKGVNGGKALEGVNIPTDVDANGLTVGSTNILPAETFYWNLGQVKTTELAMRYYVYLDGSMEGTKEAGSYATNNFAILYYDNYLENPCYKPTVSPTMAWKSATVSYAFYLVDKDGNTIINQTTGAIGGFADRIAITNPVVYDEILLNNKEGETLDIIFAKDVLPDYYIPYDNDAAYHVVVDSNGTGSWTIVKGKDENGKDLNTTTYVMNYDKNNAAAFSGALNQDGVGYDYTHTVVWFAVELIPQAHPDTVVIDYGLPVDISVLVNDMFGNAGTLTGVGPVNDAKLDLLKAVTEDPNMAASYTSTYGTAEINTATGKVRYTPSNMEMKTYDKFMYEVYYTGVTDSPEDLIGYYYDTVTVIPATTIYYEDNFVDTASYTWDNGTNRWVEKSTSLWTQIGDVNGVQDEDRPGQYALTDANNIYGYDKANLNKSTYSMGNALKATVDYDNYATASFTFWGTGFDVISMTSNMTGMIFVDVERLDATADKLTYAVDTYYGYTRDDEGNWVVDPNSTDSIYQVPIIKVVDLKYGQYKVTIEASYDPAFDHVNASYEGSYDFYLDAIRIYDPANDGAADGTEDDTIEDAYKQDHEGWPSYFELRNGLIAADTFGDQKVDSDQNGTITDDDIPIVGLVFIDGDIEVGSADIEDYISFGPNNEVYLAPGQRIAFLLSDVQVPVQDKDGNPVMDENNKTKMRSIVDRIHIGIKSADGKTGTYTITNVAAANRDGVAAGTYYGAKTYSISTATDMYYDLTGWKGDIIVISNTGNRTENGTEGIISITNIKATYTENPGTGKVYIPEDSNAGVATASVEEELDAPAVYAYMTPRAATLTLRALNAPVETEPEVPETEVPETTVPEDETTVPEETTIPEETEPAKPDNYELKDAVEAAKKLKEKDYTKESFKEFKKVLKAAEKVLRDKHASQVKIDAALEALNAAVESLEAKPDTAALKKAVDAAKKLKEKDYTKESFKEFKMVLKNVEKVLKDKNASQAEIDEALAELNEAVEALEVKAPKAKPGKK